MNYLLKGDDVPEATDVYNNPDEEPTVPKTVPTSIGRELARRIQVLEDANLNYDVDELLAAVKRDYAV